MAARVVALIEPTPAMSAANAGSAEFVQAWVDSICAEDSEEERSQWYAALYAAGYKSKRRLRGMIDEQELVTLGIPLVVARIMTQQAQRMHGEAPVVVGSPSKGAGAAQQEAWSASDIQAFPKPSSSASHMAIAPRNELLSHLQRVLYYAQQKSEDMGDRCADILNSPTMSEEDFESLDSGATRLDQVGLAALLTGSMPQATLEWVEAQEGRAASGLRIFRALAKHKKEAKHLPL